MGNRKENVKKVVNFVEDTASKSRKNFVMAAGIAAAIEFGCWCFRGLTNTTR